MLDPGIGLLTPSKSHVVDISSTDDDLTTSLPPFARRLYIGTGGNVVCKKLGDAAAVTYYNVPSAFYLDGCFVTVVKTNTTASHIVAEA